MGAPRADNLQEIESEDEFDVIIVGTSLTESILSAALSVAGARVLHLDENPFYGSHHATISLEKTHDLIVSTGTSQISEGVTSPEHCGRPGGNDVKQPSQMGRLDLNVVELGEQIFANVESYFAREDVADSLSRRVSIDLRPLVLLAGGTFVDLLIQTGAGHYLSFRPLDSTCLRFSGLSTIAEGAESSLLQKVPVSRSDVFQSKFLTMVEKRLLMRFLKTSVTVGEGEIVESGEEVELSGSFEELMARSNLTDNIRAFLRHAIVFSEILELASKNREDVSASDCRSALRTYMKSLMRYNTPTPFLYASHGSSELCEAFCRLSAVKGGTFMLRRRIESVATKYGVGSSKDSNSGETRQVDEDVSLSVCGVLTADGELLRAPHIILRSGMVPDLASPSYEHLPSWRYICILGEPAFSAEEPRVFAVFPKGVCGNASSTVHVLQMNSTAEVCPEGTFVLHAETVGRDGTSNDLIAVMSSLLSPSQTEMECSSGASAPSNKDFETESDTVRPKPLWSVLYQQMGPGGRKSTPLPMGLTVAHESGAGLDAQGSLDEARRCFCLTGRPATDFFPPSMSPDEASG